MNVLIRASSMVLLFVLIFTHFESTIERTAFREGKNFVFFERVTCRTYLPSLITNVSCRIKYIDRNHLKGYLKLYSVKPVSVAWAHGVFYYKYFTYQKIATEYWDDLCGWANGEKRSFVLDFFKPLITKYTNVNHSCPYEGLVFAKADNISAQMFSFPQIVPAGRYKIDLNLTIGERRTPMAGLTLYGSISDHRIEVV